MPRCCSFCAQSACWNSSGKLRPGFLLVPTVSQPSLTQLWWGASFGRCFCNPWGGLGPTSSCSEKVPGLWTLDCGPWTVGRRPWALAPTSYVRRNLRPKCSNHKVEQRRLNSVGWRGPPSLELGPKNSSSHCGPSLVISIIAAMVASVSDSGPLCADSWASNSHKSRSRLVVFVFNDK